MLVLHTPGSTQSIVSPSTVHGAVHTLKQITGETTSNTMTIPENIKKYKICLRVYVKYVQRFVWS